MPTKRRGVGYPLAGAYAPAGAAQPARHRKGVWSRKRVRDALTMTSWLRSQWQVEAQAGESARQLLLPLTNEHRKRLGVALADVEGVVECEPGNVTSRETTETGTPATVPSSSR